MCMEQEKEIERTSSPIPPRKEINYHDKTAHYRAICEIAENHGGKCLSKEYINNREKLLFECKKGHEFRMAPASVKGGCWCQKCCHENADGNNHDKIYYYDAVCKVVEDRGGKCLSERFVGNNDKMQFECKNQHTFYMTPANVKKGRWCPTCYYDRNAEFEKIKNIIKEKGGTCLSNEYIYSQTPITFDCGKGHVATINAIAIRNGGWCVECNHENRKLGIDYMRELAAKNKGECLSEEYINENTRLQFKCQYGNIFWKLPKDISSKDGWCGCRNCYPQAKLTIEDIKETAALFGGECLSEVYHNCDEKLTWKCQRGHIFEMTADAVRSGKWCKTCCKKHCGERLTRAIFEAAFGYKFESVKPDWLKYTKGANLELDGYCSKLNLAFEYNGRQHYIQNIKFFHMTPESFVALQQRDIYKAQKAKEVGITLIVIKEYRNNADIEGAKRAIKKELIKANVNIPENFDQISIKMSDVY